VVAVMVLGCVLFSVHDWGSPSGNRGRKRRALGRGELRGVPSTARIGGVDMGTYREFRSRHGGGPATMTPPIPK
jgi:hypothetical protein